MKRLLLLGVGSLVLLSCAANPLLTGGKVQIQLGNHDRAIELLTENVEKNPDDPEGYLWLGIAHGLKRKYDKSTLAFDKAVALDSLYLRKMKVAEPDQYWGGAPSYWVTYVNHGIHLMNDEKFEPALKTFLQAAKIQPDSSATYNYLGFCYSKLGKDEEVVKAYKRAVELSPRNLEALLNLASCHLKAKDYDEALKLMGKAVQVDSLSDRAWYLKGICHFQMEAYPEAEACFRKATELNPENKDAFYNLGIIYLRQEKVSEAVQTLEKAVELAPNDEDGWFQLGTALFTLEKYEEAADAFTKVIELNPTNADAYENRGYCRRNLGLKPEAYEDLRTAERLREEQGG